VKLSIIIPVLNSHEIVRRQLLHWDRFLPGPGEAEVLLVDDGSDPPLMLAGHYRFVTRLVRTNDTRPWTQPIARNIGAERANGEFLIFTDIDHILTREAIDIAMNFRYDYGRFKRELGVLDEDGRFSQSPEELMEYGLPEAKARGSLRISCHTLSMIVRKSVFELTGGFPEDRTHYPTHDDGHMKRRLKRLEKSHNIVKCPDGEQDERPTIYMIPNGRYCGERNANPQGLFHSLERV